jgi:hypothetical protein
VKADTLLKPSDSSIGTHAAARGERRKGLEKANVAMRQPAVVVLQSCALALALLAGLVSRSGAVDLYLMLPRPSHLKHTISAYL